jgi:periplasmic divalent cation tolerance protein
MSYDRRRHRTGRHGTHRRPCRQIVEHLIDTKGAPMEQIADVSITADSADWLADFTRSIVNDRLAACGNIIPSIRSIYRWEGAIEDDNEALVVLHTRQSLVPAIIERANREHPYDTPQVLAVPVTDANPAYRDWVLASTQDGREDG